MKQIRVSSLKVFLTSVRTVGLPRNVRTVGLPENLSQNNHGNRLTGLALMSVHTNRPTNKEEIIEDFVAIQGCRSDFGVELDLLV